MTAHNRDHSSIAPATHALRSRPRGLRAAPHALVALALTLMAVLAPRAASAQECRRSCRADETRDANGCCVAARGSSQGGGGGGTSATLPRRCPGGSTWDERARACIGRFTCPTGSHSENNRCVADAIACPSGSRMEEGRCVADITCPPGSRQENNACVTDVQCPPGTRYEENHCVSSDVQCPPGTSRQPGSTSCVGAPVCPDNSSYVEGRGCTVNVPCPTGMHAQQGVCVPDQTCLEGLQFVPGRGCVNACESYPNASWSADRHACVCNEGFALINGNCEVRQGCAAGMHMENNQCVPDVVCPYGYRFERGVGCVDPEAQAQFAAERRQRERERLEAEATQWGRGPGVQLFAGGGFAGAIAFNGLVARYRFTTDGKAQNGGVNPSWTNAMFSGGAAFVYRDFALQLGYMHIPNAATQTTDGYLDRSGGVRELWGTWTVTPNALNLLTLDIAVQGTGPVHAWRLYIGGGIDLGGNAVVPQSDSTGRRLPNGATSWQSNGGLVELGYRSQFRVWRGLFVGIDARVFGLFNTGSFGGNYCFAPRVDTNGDMMPDTSEPCSLSAVYARGDTYVQDGAQQQPLGAVTVGFGGAAQVLLGYSIY